MDTLDREREERRVAALNRYDLIDRPAEPAFEDIVHMAASVCEVPICVIAILDDHRSWIVSRVGCDLTEIPSDNAFCEYTSSGLGLFTVADAEIDPRFNKVPLIIDSKAIRFYAGQPLDTQDGIRIGTLAIVDFQPKILTEIQKDSLGRLARMTMNLLEARDQKTRRTVLQDQYKKLYEAMRDGFVQIDVHGKILDANPSFCALIGLPMTSITGMEFAAFIAPESVENQQLSLNETKLTGFSGVTELDLVSADSNLVPVEVHSFLTRDASNLPLSVLMFIRNVTDQVRANLDLKDSETKYRLLFENMATGFALHEIITDDQGKPTDYLYLAVNPAFERLTRVASNDIVGKTILEVMPGTEPYWIDLFGEVALTGTPMAYEGYASEIGRYFETWVFSPEKGQFAVLFSDITERKELEKEAKLNARRLADAVKAASDAVWEVNLNTGASYFSPRWFEMMGYAPGELEMSEDTWKNLCHPDDYAQTMAKFDQLLAPRHDGGYEAEYRVLHKNGSWLWVLGRGNVVEANENGEPIMISGTATDISDRKLAQIQLQEVNESLELRVIDRTKDLAERNQDLETFSYAVSHDLKSPLRAILAYSSMLQEAELGEEDAGFLDRIQVNGKQMATMFEGILDYSRLGSRSPKIKKVSLSETIDAVIAQFSSDPQWAKTELDIEVKDVEVMLDLEALILCLRNLVQNALKFSAESEHPRVKVLGEGRGDQVEISVHDNGIGFDIVYTDKIFQLFHRLQSGSTSGVGSGIGLALVARALVRLKGTVDVKSKIGVGSTFTMRIPTATISAGHPQVTMR